MTSGCGTAAENRLLYFSPVFWRSYAQRPHYFAEYFLSNVGSRVLWVDPYLSRLPKMSDLRQTPRLHDQNTRTLPGLQVRGVPALPVEPLPGGMAVNALLFWRPLWKALEQFCAGGRTVIGVGKPTGLAMKALEALPHCGSFFDAMDDFPQFHSGLSRRAVQKYEEGIARRVDEIYASSTFLVHKWSSIHGRVTRIFNACDTRNLGELPIAPRSSTPHFGYLGSVASWFDWGLLLDLARAFPEARVHLVGPVFTPPPSRLPENVVLHAACPQEEVKAYYDTFTLGLIPFKLNPLTRGVDPIKYYEYRAHGLPVLTTPFGEMADRSRENGVFVLEGGDSLKGAVRNAMAFKDDAGSVGRFREENNWPHRLKSSGAFGPNLLNR